MKINKLAVAATLAVLLAACGKDAPAPAVEASPAADAAAADTSDVAAADAPVVAGLPQECEDYLDRAKACMSKANPQAAAAFQQGIDQSKEQWETMADRTGLAAACTSANEAFTQTATALQCE